MAITLNFNNTLDYINEIKSYGRFKVNRVVSGEIRVGFFIEHAKKPTQIQGNKPTFTQIDILNMAATHVIVESDIPVLVRMVIQIGETHKGEVLPKNLESISNIHQEGETAWTTAGRILREITRIAESKKLKVIDNGYYAIN